MIPIVLPALQFTASLVFRLGSVMFISLFGIEILMQMGLLQYLKPVGRPVAKAAGLPAESALSFLAALGSMIAAHSMAVGFHGQGKLTDRELILTGVLNTVPFHVKETLTFQLPVVLPLLGPRLALIYLVSFWLTGLLKLIYVLAAGRLHPVLGREGPDAFDEMVCAPEDPACEKPSFPGVIQLAWKARKRMFFKMMIMLASVTFIIQLMVEAGWLAFVERGIAPLTSLLGLPAAVAGPVTAYAFSPTAGITYMANLLANGGVTPAQAITALMAGGLIMIPVTRMRRTMPRYIALFGAKIGLKIAAITMGAAMLSRVLMLVWILIWF